MRTLTFAIGAIISYIAWNVAGNGNTVGAVGLIVLFLVACIVISKFFLPTVDEIWQAKRTERRRAARAKADKAHS